MCTLDIICETIMGYVINAQKNKCSDYVQAIQVVGEAFTRRLESPAFWIEPIFRLSQSGRQFFDSIKELHEFTTKVIQGRKKELQKEPQEAFNNADDDDVYGMKSSYRRPFLDILLREHLKDPHNFTEEDVREEVDTFMFEGHDTTAMGISWALYLIGLYREQQDLIHQELDSIFGDDKVRQITSNDLKEMKYLECCLKESQRLYPSVPFIARTCKGNLVIAGNTVPKGATVQIPIYNLHRDETVFPKPEEFIPERFLPENAKGRHPFAYIPFSAGPRNCIVAVSVSPPATTREERKEELPSSRESLLCVPEVAIVPLQDYRRLTRHSKFVQKQPLRWLERLGHPLDVSLAVALLVPRRPTSRLRRMSRALSWAFSERLLDLNGSGIETNCAWTLRGSVRRKQGLLDFRREVAATEVDGSRRIYLVFSPSQFPADTVQAYKSRGLRLLRFGGSPASQGDSFFLILVVGWLTLETANVWQRRQPRRRQTAKTFSMKRDLGQATRPRCLLSPLVTLGDESTPTTEFGHVTSGGTDMTAGKQCGTPERVPTTYHVISHSAHCCTPPEDHLTLEGIELAPMARNLPSRKGRAGNELDFSPFAMFIALRKHVVTWSRAGEFLLLTDGSRERASPEPLATPIDVTAHVTRKMVKELRADGTIPWSQSGSAKSASSRRSSSLCHVCKNQIREKRGAVHAQCRQQRHRSDVTKTRCLPPPSTTWACEKRTEKEAESETSAGGGEGKGSRDDGGLRDRSKRNATKDATQKNSSF
ncbi:hypothetical protein HPB47_011417 [Ixodes persulcatus]|uniref:Uncharacterized protein n=1 Tax=Ixodes persulcatus TaxID=34615 RepID=A0AC60NWI4_IXOPE|nr:hypothetical protein HPB47_011417 [Ixodes persulcatus]